MFSKASLASYAFHVVWYLATPFQPLYPFTANCTICLLLNPGKENYHFFVQVRRAPSKQRAGSEVPSQMHGETGHTWQWFDSLGAWRASGGVREVTKSWRKVTCCGDCRMPWSSWLRPLGLLSRLHWKFPMLWIPRMLLRAPLRL